MRILLISGEFPPDVGGVGDYTHRLALALADRGQQIAVLTGRYGLIDVPATAARAAVAGTSKLETWSMRPYTAAIDVFKPEIVHLQYQTGAYGMHSAVLLLPARLKRLRRDVAVVVTAHDLRLPYLFPKADLLRARLTGRLFGDADAVVVTNRDDALRLDGLAPPDRELYSPRRPLRTRHVIPIGSNIEPPPPAAYDGTARAALGAGPETFLLGYFGLLSRTKGVIELLDALRTLPQHVRLLIVGGAAPLPDDRRFAGEVETTLAAYGLAGRVTITGALPAPQVSAQLLACDAGVLPFADGASYRRGSLLAMLAHGLPVITTLPAAPLDPPLRDGLNALLVPAGDTAALGAAILRLAGDPRLRLTLSDGARELAARFGWPAIAEQHENVYHSLLKESRA